MKKIKFSHSYWKLPPDIRCRRESTVTLLQVIKINYKNLSKKMIDYDTKYSNNKIYELPKTDLILLIFKTSKHNEIFTTIRRFVNSKWKYYKSSEGEKFEVVMNERRDKKP